MAAFWPHQRSWGHQHRGAQAERDFSNKDMVVVARHRWPADCVRLGFGSFGATERLKNWHVAATMATPCECREVAFMTTMATPKVTNAGSHVCYNTSNKHTNPHLSLSTPLISPKPQTRGCIQNDRSEHPVILSALTASILYTIPPYTPVSSVI